MAEQTILCVDDEPFILKSLQRLLRRHPYKLLTAESGPAGLEILEQNDVQLVISDQRMPDMSGTEFLKIVKEKYPNTIRVVLSGYAEANVILSSINQGEVYRYLLKPWNYDELILTIGQCFEQYELTRSNRELFETVQSQNQELEKLNKELETMVTERTQSLQLSQEILAELPLPVIGISADRQITLSNTSARAFTHFKSEIMPGSSVDDTFSDEAIKHINTFLAQNDKHQISELSDLAIRLRFKRLSNKDRGCILVLDPIDLLP